MMEATLAGRAALLLLLLSLETQSDTITGRVVDGNGVGVAGVDIDVKNLGSGGTPNISGDGTDADGFFSTTLPAGLYRVFFKPPPPPVTPTVEQIDLKCYAITNSDGFPLPPLGLPLVLSHLNPVLRQIPGVPPEEQVVVQEPQQLCVPVQKSLPPPPSARVNSQAG